MSVAVSSRAQENLPKDYLDKSFHNGRRQAFRDKMPSNSVAVIFSFPERTFSNDVNYVFHQNPDLYYLTGYKEPDAVLLLFKEQQTGKNGVYNEAFFVRQRDPSRETWTGRRLGAEGVKSQLGISNAYNGAEFENAGIDFKKFSTVIYDELPDDVKTDRSGFDLFGLLQTFRQSIRQPDEKEINLHALLARVAARANPSNLQRIISFVKEQATADSTIKNNALISELLGIKDSTGLRTLITKIKALPKWEIGRAHV